MTKHFCGLLVLIALVLCGCYSTAEMRSRAEAGDVSAQSQVGMAYFYGAPPENRINYDLAFRYFKMAAEAKDPIAMYHLGEIYEKGLGSTAPDYRLARQYYIDALPGIRRTKGPFDGDSRFVNAKMFYFGRGEVRDVKRAGTYFRRAAKCGSYEAMLHLAAFYAGEAKDSGITPDLGKAKELLEKASTKGYPAARYGLALLLKDAPEQSKKLMEQSALSDYPPAVIYVAIQSGDPKALHKAYLRAARMGYAKAISELPVNDADVKKQLELLSAAAARGDQESMLRLAQSYQKAGELFKAIAAYYLLDTVKGVDLATDLALLALDKQTAMVWVMVAAWDKYRTADALSLLENRIGFFIEGYESNIAGVRENLNRYLTTAAEDSLLGVEYLRLLNAKGDASSRLAGDVFKNVPVDKRDFNYYLQYALLAGICGQGDIQLDAVYRATKSSNFTEVSTKYPVLAEYLKLLHGNALVLIGRAPEAYEYLFANNLAGRPAEQSAAMLNFVNQPWCSALRLDADKLAVSTGLKRQELAPGVINSPLPTFDVSFNCDSDKIAVPVEPELFEEAIDDLSNEKPTSDEPIKTVSDQEGQPLSTPKQSVLFLEDEEIL